MKSKLVIAAVLAFGIGLVANVAKAGYKEEIDVYLQEKIAKIEHLLKVNPDLAKRMIRTDPALRYLDWSEVLK